MRGNSFDGLRKTFEKEFAKILVFDLRGNQRTKGETSRKEGGKVFDSGSRSPIAVTIFVKDNRYQGNAEIKYFGVQDYLTRNEKLELIGKVSSIEGLSRQRLWIDIKPNEQGDWLDKRDQSFTKYIPLKQSSKESMFVDVLPGHTTNRDFWCFNSSTTLLQQKIKATIAFYNSELARLDTFEINNQNVDSFIDFNDTEIKWSRGLKSSFVRKTHIVFDPGAITDSIFRPFQKQKLYLNGLLNESIGRIANIIPSEHSGNLLIAVSGKGTADFSCLMTDVIPSYDLLGKTQIFPRRIFDQKDQRSNELDLDPKHQNEVITSDGLTDCGLAHFRATYLDETITKDDLFYYVYGLLHSPDYRTRFADNLSKQLPRIPAVKQAADFWSIVEAGRKLGDLHCDYESVEPYGVTIAQGDLRLANIPDPEKYYRVEKMKFHKVRNKDGKLVPDKSTVIYNSNITITGIPLEAYDYVVNGKSAIDWVMERQCVKIDKKSGIVNDANAYANETVGDSAYPLKLLQRVITVSLETMKIVNALPKLEID